jgi:hypothetical protein
LLINL